MLLLDSLRTAAFAKLVFQMMESVNQVPHMGFAGNILGVTSREIRELRPSMIQCSVLTSQAGPPVTCYKMTVSGESS